MTLISSSSNIDLNHSTRKVLTLPRIAHPSSSFDENDQKDLDIRGKSRNGDGNGQLIRSERSTPDLSFQHRRRTRSSSLKQSHISSSNQYPTQLTQIPENISTIIGEDRDKVRLPIFGKENLWFC